MDYLPVPSTLVFGTKSQRLSQLCATVPILDMDLGIMPCSYCVRAHAVKSCSKNEDFKELLGKMLRTDGNVEPSGTLGRDPDTHWSNDCPTLTLY